MKIGDAVKIRDGFFTGLPAHIKEAEDVNGKWKMDGFVWIEFDYYPALWKSQAFPPQWFEASRLKLIS